MSARPDGPRYDVVVLGATGITGRLVAAHLARRAGQDGSGPGGRPLRWAAAGRDEARVRQALERIGVEADVLVADVTDTASLDALAASTRAVANVVGPYTTRAQAVIGACVRAGTHYADLTGEIPHAAAMIERWHAPAVAAGAKVVQVAGFEALPFDVAVALAHDAAAAAGETLVEADAVFGASTTPRLSALTDAVSGGTLQSLVEVLAEPGEADLADPALLLPGLDASSARALRRASPLRLGPRSRAGTVLSPTVPAAFINPPVIARTAALLSAGGARADEPLAYREGGEVGPATSRAAWAAAWGLTLLQLALLGASTLPHPVRAAVAAGLAKVLPGPGTGPTTEEVLEGWEWHVDVAARTATGQAVTVRADARGHPGYAATARMLAELCAAMARGCESERAGCLTPALALGTADLGTFAASGVGFRVLDSPAPVRR